MDNQREIRRARLRSYRSTMDSIPPAVIAGIVADGDEVEVSGVPSKMTALDNLIGRLEHAEEMPVNMASTALVVSLQEQVATLRRKSD